MQNVLRMSHNENYHDAADDDNDGNDDGDCDDDHGEYDHDPAEDDDYGDDDDDNDAFRVIKQHIKSNILFVHSSKIPSRKQNQPTRPNLEECDKSNSSGEVEQAPRS